MIRSGIYGDQVAPGVLDQDESNPSLMLACSGNVVCRDALLVPLRCVHLASSSEVGIASGTKTAQGSRRAARRGPPTDTPLRGLCCARTPASPLSTAMRST